MADVIGKFQLGAKCGTHTESGDGGQWFVQPGQVVEGRSHLSKRFPEKFTQVDNDRKVTATFIPNAENGQPQSLANAAVQEVINIPVKDKPVSGPSKEDLDTFETYKSMTVAELKQLAASEEMELGDAKNKKDILDVFAASLGIDTPD